VAPGLQGRLKARPGRRGPVDYSCSHFIHQQNDFALAFPDPLRAVLLVRASVDCWSVLPLVPRLAQDGDLYQTEELQPDVTCQTGCFLGGRCGHRPDQAGWRWASRCEDLYANAGGQLRAISDVQRTCLVPGVSCCALAFPLSLLCRRKLNGRQLLAADVLPLRHGAPFR
jgi:hypothetical protein